MYSTSMVSMGLKWGWPWGNGVSSPSKVLFPARSFVVLLELGRQRCYAACFLALTCGILMRMFHVGFRDLYHKKTACKISLACALLLDVTTLWHQVQPSLLVMFWLISSRSQTDREQSTWYLQWYYYVLHSRKPRNISTSWWNMIMIYDAMVNGI